VDKLTLAALEATLRGPRSPTWEALHADPDALRARAEQLCESIADAGHEVAVASSAAVVGGGGAPGVLLPSWAVTLPQRYAPALRRAETPVLGRVEKGRLLLDLRAVPAEHDALLHKAIAALAA
jgi:L-seryl-tRNA(Ser) seleniumtransferase